MLLHCTKIKGLNAKSPNLQLTIVSATSQDAWLRGMKSNTFVHVWSKIAIFYPCKMEKNAKGPTHHKALNLENCIRLTCHKLRPGDMPFQQMDGLISCLGCLGPKIEQSCKLQPHTGLKMFHTQTGAVTSHQPSLGIVRTVWLLRLWGVEVRDFGVDGCPPLLIQLWSGDPNCSAKTNLPSQGPCLQMHTRSQTPFVPLLPSTQLVGIQEACPTFQRHMPKRLQWSSRWRWSPGQTANEHHKWELLFHSPACRSTKPSFQTCPGSNWKDDAHAVWGTHAKMKRKWVRPKRSI